MFSIGYRAGPGRRLALATIAALALTACEVDLTELDLTPDQGGEPTTVGTPEAGDGSDTDEASDDGAAPEEPDDAEVEDDGSDEPDRSTAGDGDEEPTETTEAETPAIDKTPAQQPPAGGGDRFVTLPPGADLPSGAECASRVRPTPEVREVNATFNATRGTDPHDTVARVDGDFTGTTDEIIQWAACKWGIDEDIARAQVAKESWWRMTSGGDRTTNQEICHLDLRTGPGEDCPESIGLMQVRWQYHPEAFEDNNAINSSAYNVDYAYSVWRDCYDGKLDWLNTVDRGAEYAAGDLDGCLGVWFSGRWHTQQAEQYIAAVHDYLNQRIWEQPDFING